MARVAVITVSDRASSGERPDATGPRLAAGIEADGHEVVHRSVVSDDEEGLRDDLVALCDSPDAPDVILTAGGTGIGPRDRAPEATRPVLDRIVPGIAEALRAAARPSLPVADLSRGLAGVRRETLVVNLPGSPGGAEDGWRVLRALVSHAVDQLHGGDHHRGDGRGQGSAGGEAPLR